jgi:sugar transferase (PEP-CTERM/EpsH1 system associated)
MRLIKRLEPDIVHTRNWGTIDGIIAAKLAKRSRVIHGEHGREVFDLKGSNSKRNTMRRILGRWVDYFVAVSDEIQFWLVNKVGLNQKRVVTIYNGVDTETFCPPIDKKKMKQSLGMDPNTFIIGTVGRLDRVKNYQMLLRAMLSLKGFDFPCKLLFIGEGPERAGLEEFTGKNRLANVEFLGEKQNVSDYLKVFDLFVLTSLAEGMSNTILEAMAAGLPVVATRVGGNSEMIQDGRTGLLVPSDDHLSLTKAMAEYCGDRNLCMKHGQAARQRCEELYNINIMVKKYEKLYLTLMEEARSF